MPPRLSPDKSREVSLAQPPMERMEDAAAADAASSSEDELDDGEAEAMPLLDRSTAAADQAAAEAAAREGRKLTAAASAAERKRGLYETTSGANNEGGADNGGGDLDISFFAHLYGPLREHRAQMPRVAFLSATLCCIIGSFWLLDSLKDTVFATVVGLEHQPLAKMLSVVTTLGLVLYYNQLLDRVATPKLFYLIGTAYTLLFGLIAFLLSNDYIGMANTDAHPSRIIGWVALP